MTKGIIFSIIIGLGVGLWISLPVEPKTTGQVLGKDLAWKDYSPYRILETARAKDFDLTIPIEANTLIPLQNRALRIILHYTDKNNYVAITIGEDSTSVDEIVSGLLLNRASVQTPFPLTANPRGVFRVKWRKPYLTLLMDGELVLSSTLTTLSQGQVGLGKDLNITTGQLSVQPVVPIAFSDDFMRGKNDPSPWEPVSGDWLVHSLDNPSRSANSFVCQAVVPEGGYSLIGSEYWDKYRVEVSVCGSPDSAAGLVFNAYGNDDAFIFRWGARSGDEKSTPMANSMQLVRLKGGKETIIAEKPGGFRPEQWARLEVLTDNGQAACYLDGNLIFQYSDPRLYGGRTGLYAYGSGGVDFDDFQVRSYRGKLASPDEKSPTDWEKQGDTILYGREQWNGYSLTAVVEPTLDDKSSNNQIIALVAAYQGPMNHVLYEVRRLDDGMLKQRLLRVSDGEEDEILDQGKLPGDALGVHKDGHKDNSKGDPKSTNLKIPVELALDSGVLSVTLGGSPTLYGYLGNDAAGRCGFQGASAKQHSEVLIQPIEPVLPIVSVNQVFSEESLMKSWSGAAGEWREEETESKQYDHIFWHRTHLYHDVEIEALIPAQKHGEDSKPLFTEESELALSIAKPVVSQETKNGYTLRYRPMSKDEPQLQLLRAGEEVDAYTLSEPVPLRRLRLRQKGPFVLAYVDDEPQIVYRDSDPLTGLKVAWATRSFPITAENVLVYNQNLKNYLFSQAPVDWRIGAGVWEVTNRWECDFRWNFWAGMPGRLARLRANSLSHSVSKEAKWKVQDLLRQVRLLPNAKDKHTVLWHKGEFSGDMMFDIYLAQMHDQSRGGGQYNRYASDFNITISADGRDLSSGYNCIYGGWKNSKSVIMRKNEIVEEKAIKLALSGSHRRWVRMCVKKEGDTIYFNAYTEFQPDQPEQHLLSMQYTDPEPLQGKHIAIWSYDNGILVSRARISAEEIGPYDNPTSTWPAQIKSAYTKEK